MATSTQLPPVTPPRPSTSSRYPTHLSRRVPPSSSAVGRPPLHHRGTSHMYETLEDLLREAGYKETRIFTPEAPERGGTSSSSSGETVGGTVVKLLSTWMTRHVDPDATPTPSPNTTPKRPLRHTLSAPQMPARHAKHAPPSPSWLTSLFSPRTPPSTPQRQRPTTPRLLSAHPRAASSHAVVTMTNVVCRPVPVRKGSSTSSSRSGGGKSSRASSSSRGSKTKKKNVPMLVCQSSPGPCRHDHNGDDSSRSSTTDEAEEEDDNSEDEDEIDLTSILIPAKRQHSIRSLRTVLHNATKRPASSAHAHPYPHRRISSLNPSRDRPRSPLSPSQPTTPSTSHRYAAYQTSLPARITREPLREEPERMDVDTDGGEEGHWDSGEFMSAKVKRKRSRLPGAWGAWGR